MIKDDAIAQLFYHLCVGSNKGKPINPEISLIVENSTETSELACGSSRRRFAGFLRDVADDLLKE